MNESSWIWWLDIPMVVLGVLANRAATYIRNEVRHGGLYAIDLSIKLQGTGAMNFVTLWVIGALPLAFLNGFLLRKSWIDCLVVGFGTWIGTLVLIFFTRNFKPFQQFLFFSTANLVWLIVDVVLLIVR